MESKWNIRFIWKVRLRLVAMVMIWIICDPPYLVLECWLEIVNSNDLGTITQAEIYESAKILQDLAKVKTT